ncbi:MAG: enoyl-CoA hydratase [Pseudomonadota bacterium]
MFATITNQNLVAAFVSISISAVLFASAIVPASPAIFA